MFQLYRATNYENRAQSFTNIIQKLQRVIYSTNGVIDPHYSMGIFVNAIELGDTIINDDLLNF